MKFSILALLASIVLIAGNEPILASPTPDRAPIQSTAVQTTPIKPTTDAEYIIIPFWAKPVPHLKDTWNARLRGYVLKKSTSDSYAAKGLSTLLGGIMGQENWGTVSDRLKYAYAAINGEQVKVKSARFITKAGYTSNWFDIPNKAYNEDSSFDLTIELHLKKYAKEGDWVTVELLLENGDAQKVDVPLIGTQGLTVISDIDDTIKDTRVLQKSYALKATAYLPMEAVPGMKEFYHNLKDTYQKKRAHGAISTYRTVAFHYVSASPFELHPTLTKFLEEAKFPRATIMPSPLRMRYLLDAFKMDLRRYKRMGTEKIINQFPERKYLLIGDSGQMDPEGYGDVVRMSPHGKQVKCILIRLVTDQNAKVEAVKNTKARFNLAFQGIEATQWRVFKDPSELNKVDFNGLKCYGPGESNQWYEQIRSVDQVALPEGAVMTTKKTDGTSVVPAGLENLASGQEISKEVDVVTLKSNLAEGVASF